MRELAKNNRKGIETHTTLDYERLQRITYLYEFDREVQLVTSSHILPLQDMADRSSRCPLWGYPTEDAYYRDASSTDAVLAIQIPFLAIHAVDDPVGTPKIR